MNTRIQVGIARFSDGWNVISKVGEARSVYDPTYATEAEAEEAARQIAATLRFNLEVIE